MWVQRHLHPQLAGQLADQLAPPAEGIAAPLRALEDATWPENLVFMRERLLDVGHRTLDMVKGFVEAARTSADPLDLYRAVRRFARVQETLYPLAPAFDPVSRWFLDPALRGNDDLVARLRVGALRDDGVEVGVLHADNERESRGGFSLYVPEAWDGQASMPLVVALHGGSGPRARFSVELATRGARAERARAVADCAGPHVVDHGRRRRRRRPAARDDRVRGRAVSGRSRAGAVDRHVRRRHVRAPAGSPQRAAVHASGPGLRRAPSAAVRRRAGPRAGLSDLSDSRRAGLDVSYLHGADGARRAALGRRAAGLSRDRGSVAHVSAG